jgi:hypothetical protein
MMEPCTFDVGIVRQGKRLCLVEATMLQRDVVVATARALFLEPTPLAHSAGTWAPEHDIAPPPIDLAPTTVEARLYHSDGIGWTADATRHQNAFRKRLWLKRFGIVKGESVSPFQFVACASDVASVVTNWGEAGVEFINACVTLSLVRTPIGSEIGFAAADRLELDGLATGSVVVFDRAGALGTVVVSAMINAQATVDPARR